MQFKKYGHPWVLKTTNVYFEGTKKFPIKSEVFIFFCLYVRILVHRLVEFCFSYNILGFSQAFEAESTYKKACMDVETQMRLLQKVKSEVLHSLQALLLQYDQTIKAASMNYFQLQHNQSSMTPMQVGVI